MADGVTAVLAVLVIVLTSVILRLLWLRRQERHRQKLLVQQIEYFLAQPTAPVISLVDDGLADLENGVSGLENRILLAEESIVRESRQNADFLADISHQLKTPLAAMRLFCELDAGVSTHSEAQLELTQRMEKLIQSLLLLEKLKADAYQMRFAPCDIRQILNQAWAELQPLFTERRLEIHGDATMRLDAGWMTEAIQNILKNACEHPAKNPVIEVELMQTEASTTMIISDHGGGLPESELRRIFERFQRTTQPSAAGSTGLGLAITRTIVEKHHGTVFAENRGDGLCLTICLPIFDGRLAY